VTHAIIANNQAGVNAAADAAGSLGYSIGTVATGVEGEAAVVARDWIARSLGVSASLPAAFVLGGETTVTVGTRAGLGGPSQEFALAGAGALADLKGRRAALVAFSTDGVDGPTDAAGAVVTESTWSDLMSAGVDAAAALGNHDSHRALDRVGAVIRTGATGTNVNHIAVLFVY
jgi:glycerate 2-kinase